MFDDRIYSVGIGKLESVIQFSDLHGGESVLFVFPDETADLLTAAAVIADRVPDHVVPLYLRRGELFQLSLPYTGPRQPPGTARNLMSRGSFHNVGWAKHRSTLIHGEDIRSRLTLPRRPVNSLRHHLEISAGTVRYSVILPGLVSRRSLIRDLKRIMDELMLSVLLATNRECWVKEEIEINFPRAAPQVEPILDEWKVIEADTDGQPEWYFEEREYRAVWLYERFTAALREFADTLAESGERGSPTRHRHQLDSDRLRRVESIPKRPWLRGDEALNAAFFALKRPETAIYFDAIEAGLRHLIEIQSTALSMTFYGSLARNTLRPNRSDLCDAVLVLDDGWWCEYGDFRRVLKAMIQSNRTMGQWRIPFHPFKYMSLTEWTHCHPAMFLSEWASDALSRVALGEDLRSEAGSSSAGVSFARRILFTFPLLSRRCAKFLRRKDLSQSEIEVVLKILSSGIKLIPRSICAACDIWADNAGSLKQLANLTPGLDLSLVKAANDQLQCSSRPTDALRTAESPRYMLEFVEQAYDATIKWLESHNQIDMMLDI